MGSHVGASRYRLGMGVLDLAVDVNWSGAALFQVAERINPKRSFLFVSTVLGRHIPVRPSDHFAAVDALVDQVPDGWLDGPVLVVGYAETAVGIGAAVARRIAWRRPDVSTDYLTTTRHPVVARVWLGFSEGHSHATAHHVLAPGGQGASLAQRHTLVVVDDETTTGSTFAALFGVLRDGGLSIGRVLLLTLTDWSDGAAARSVSALLPERPVDAFSLVRGRWGWVRDPAVTPPDIPTWSEGTSMASWVPDHVTDPLLRAPRLGLRMEEPARIDALIERLQPAGPGEPILVIGTGEHVWGPMLLAERLEQEGADVRVVATTRSPILMGEVIRHKLTFMDHFGIGIPMYLHNVPARPDAHVIVLTETDASNLCPELLRHLGRGQIVDGTGNVVGFQMP